MSYVLRQIPINCPKCGEYLFRAFYETYDLTKGETTKKEDDPVCKKCSGRTYIEALKGAQKIEVLTQQIHSHDDVKKHGEKIEKLNPVAKNVQSPDDFIE